MVRRTSATILAAVLVVGLLSIPAGADTKTTNGVPLTCQTSYGAQSGSYSATVTDAPDPASVGGSVSYRFVVPFEEANPGVTATYKGGQTSYRIPAGLTVTSVSTQPPPGGSQISSTASVQGDSVVVTSTANVPIDGTTYPTPDLLVSGTVQGSAAGPGIQWLVPYRIVANVAVQGLGTITATCTPDDPSVVISSTAVPAGSKPPVAQDQSVALEQGTSRSITLSASDADTPQSSLTWSVATPPAHGTLTGTPPSVTYTPDPAYSGLDSFVFRVSDPDGNSDTGTVSINVFSRAVVDNTPPTIVVTSPANGAVYTPGQVVDAAYSCADTTTGVASCAGSTSVGASIPTTVGQHTFTVDARDDADNLARTTVSYRVIDPTPVHQPYDAGAGTDLVPLDCGSLLPLSSDTLPVVASAPHQVGTGRTFRFRVAIGAGSVPRLTTATNLRYVLEPFAHGTVVSAAFVPGTGSADVQATSSLAVSSNQAVMTIAGPIGSTTATSPTAYTPRAFDVTVRADSAADASVPTRFVDFRVHTVTGVVPQDRDCAGGNAGQGLANPTLTSTRIVDTTPPLATLTEPGNGDVVVAGDSITADYACADDHALASCTGTTADGAAVDTSTPGIETFQVTAKDAAGNVAQRFVSFTVESATVTYEARFDPAQAPLLDATAAWLGVSRDDLPRVGVAFLRYLVAANPSSPPSAVVPPPANDGTLVIPTTYPRAQVPGILATAQQFGLDGGQLHYLATEVLAYIYAISH